MNKPNTKIPLFAMAALLLLGLLWTAKTTGFPFIAAPAQPVAQHNNDRPPDSPPGALPMTAAPTGVSPEKVTTPVAQVHLLVCNPPRAANAAGTACILPAYKVASGGNSALIPVTGGPLKLDCKANTLELPGGDRVVIRGLCGDYWAAVVQETVETLPLSASLYSFMDGITLQLLQGADTANLTPLVDMPPGALISYDFLIMPQVAENHLLGLQLNGDAWQEMGSARTGFFMEIPANVPGTFVVAAP